jgi:hypothetical protein
LLACSTSRREGDKGRFGFLQNRVAPSIVRDVQTLKVSPFSKVRPIAVMARGVLERLLDAERVGTLFKWTAERQYTRELLLSTLVDMMSEVVLGVQPSVHAAYQARMEEMMVSTPINLPERLRHFDYHRVGW